MIEFEQSYSFLKDKSVHLKKKDIVMSMEKAKTNDELIPLTIVCVANNVCVVQNLNEQD